jgi:histidinol dehydrogenase
MKMKSVSSQVEDILSNIASKGDAALFAYSKRFDSYPLTRSTVEVSASEIVQAAAKLEASTRLAIRLAASNIRSFHLAERKRAAKTWMIKGHGTKRGQIISPVQSTGIYVPGGRYPYPSTVLMAAIPAKVAGVKQIIMVSPPKNITPAVLYAAKVAGVDRIFRIGGPAAIGALAYGTKSVPKVDIIVGPGNAYVNEAKRQVYGLVGIDSLAGPSEVAIIADATAPADYIVSDVKAQLEHDERAVASVFCMSNTLAKEVARMLEKPLLVRITLKTVTPSKAIELVNYMAPEHLELMVKDTAYYLKSIKNAGAIFAGSATPTALGDYWAGPSHVLPTAGTARFSSGLSVATFLKRSSYIEYSPQSTKACADCAAEIASTEGMSWHEVSLNIRK